MSSRVLRAVAAVFALTVLLGGLGLPLLGLVLPDEPAPFCCGKGRCCCTGDASPADGRACLRRSCGCEQTDATVAGAPLSFEAVLPAVSRLPRLALRSLEGPPASGGLRTRPHSPPVPPPGVPSPPDPRLKSSPVGVRPAPALSFVAAVRGRGVMRECVVWAAAGLMASLAGAEEPRGRIAGSVTSRDEARLPRVVLVITGATGGAGARLSTGSLGTFRSPELAPGAYDVRATLAGFRDAVVAGVLVRAGEDTPLDLVLDVATFSETVSVVGEAPRGTLEASELREAPAVDVGEALSFKAGLWRLRKGGIANDVVLRGLQSRDLNVLIDGQRVYGACPNHMDPAAFHVDFAEVDRVEVGKGPFDVKNEGSLGGTINVVTRKPEPGWHATPNVAAGSFGYVNPSLTVGRGGERISALAGYSYRTSDPFRDGDGRRFTEITNYRPQDQADRAYSIGTAWGRVVWAPATGHQLDLAYTRQDAGAILYPYLLMDALWDDTDRLNLRYEATGLGARRASVRAQGYLTRVDHWMTDERRTSSLAKPRAYSMGTQAETRTAGGKVEAVLGRLNLGLEGYERYWDATNEMAGSGYAPQAMIPGVAVRVGGAFAEYQRPLGHGLGAVGGRAPRRGAERGGRHAGQHGSLRGLPGDARRSRPRTRSRRATCASPGAAGPARSRAAWDTPPACRRRPSATWPCDGWAPTGWATPPSSPAATPRSTPPRPSPAPGSAWTWACTGAGWTATSPSTTSPAAASCPAS